MKHMTLLVLSFVWFTTTQVFAQDKTRATNHQDQELIIHHGVGVEALLKNHGVKIYIDEKRDEIIVTSPKGELAYYTESLITYIEGNVIILYEETSTGMVVFDLIQKEVTNNGMKDYIVENRVTVFNKILPEDITCTRIDNSTHTSTECACPMYLSNFKRN